MSQNESTFNDLMELAENAPESLKESARKILDTCEVQDWKKEFDELIRNYSNNLEITHGELVDGSIEPIKNFIRKVRSQAIREFAQRVEKLPIVAQYETQEGVDHPINASVIVVHKAISRDQVLTLIEEENANTN